MTSSRKAAIHLGPRHTENLDVSKNSEIEDIESLFIMTKKLFLENSEIRNVNCLDSTSPSRTRSTLLSDRAVKWMKAKVHVYSDSVLCLGKIHDPGEAIEQCKGQMASFRVKMFFTELLGLDGEPIEFEWKIVQGFTALQILQEIQSDLEGAHIEPEEFSDRIIFMSMFNDTDLNKKGNEASCALTSTKIQEYAFEICERTLGIRGTRRRRKVVSWV